MNLKKNSVPFRVELLRWFYNNARILPWRTEPHWYKTFLSEFMLQQTQVEQVIPYFHKFYNKYPDVHQLASADEQEVLTLWAGLGYYSRARNLRKAAIKIVKEFSGEFPKTVKDALSLPGVGTYTAHAILSIAFNKPLAVVDGNVKRVISRIITLNKDISSAQGIKKISSASELLLDKTQPSKYNEAVMELGATICLPRSPLCHKCPLQLYCEANKKALVHKYPLKSPKKKKQEVFFYAFVIEHKGQILITKRASKGLLASMWEFPSLEGQENDLYEFVNKKLGIVGENIQIFSCIKHQYTHLNACYTPIRVIPEKITKMADIFPDHKWIKAAYLDNYPIHTAHKKIIEKLKI